MAATTLPKSSYTTDNQLLLTLSSLFPEINIRPAKNFSWSPKDSTVFFSKEHLVHSDHGKLALLHEVGHGILRHSNYSSDVDLILKEVGAWQQARALAEQLGIVFDADHVEDCLDTYRDWLHKRSTCPTCLSNALQSDSHTYQCFNCNQLWHVSVSRFCRSYRLKST
jgi:hypothetical protein